MRFAMPLVLVLSACGPKKKLKHAAVAGPAPIDTELIEGGDPDEPMEIVTTERSSGRTLLATPSKPVDLEDPALGLLVSRMSATLAKAEGVGIAAPQVGVLSRIILVERQDLDEDPVRPYFNPALTWSSPDQVAGWEGCLSVPDERGQVSRSNTIRVAHDTVEGHVEEEVSDWTARIFQHELDHLDGVLFTEKLLSAKTLTADEYSTVRDLWDALDEEGEVVAPAEQEPEPESAEDHVEPPFSAETIRSATGEGRRYTWRVKEYGATVFRGVVLVEVGDDSLIMRRSAVDDEGEIERTVDSLTTWNELESHSHFPIEKTVISESWVDTPAGAFDTIVYTVNDPIGFVTTYWFARDLPGAPVRLEARDHETLIVEMELVDHRPGE
ncbi:MAG: peptide deformylase [Proteobacteria bacterium]|jgi:peptide deformylase|nr:peptide deformylase [Pseudomonadota bacterium]